MLVDRLSTGLLSVSLAIVCLLLIAFNPGCGTETSSSPTTVSQDLERSQTSSAPSLQPAEKASVVPSPASLAEDRSWEKQRLDAVALLYDLTQEGIDVIDSLDVRQMWAQPLYFKSSGFNGWLGIGEAKPFGVIHELSHSYWGAFPVRGFPELSWEAQPGQDLSSAMERYHEDILAFVAQPPDHYEVLRARFRDPPGISREKPGLLFHLMEADMVASAAGDLNLVPPIFRKYWEPFLRPGQFQDWYEAMAWYIALGADDRPLANTYLGFNHLDLEPYRGLESPGPAKLAGPARDILLREDVQRLLDFAEQFQSFQVAPQEQEDFNGWRAYLRVMAQLYGRHPEVLPSSGYPVAVELAQALTSLKGLEARTPEHAAHLFIQEIDRLPLLEYLLPVLDNRTLVALFTTDSAPLAGKSLKGSVAFRQLLEAFAPQVSSVIALGQRRVPEAAAELSAILETMDWERRADLSLFIDLLRDYNPETFREIVASLDDALLRRLLEVVPGQLRFILRPPRLLELLKITETAAADEVMEGIDALMTSSSGASRVDAPFVEGLYQVIAARGRGDAVEALCIISGSLFPLEGFIELHPEDAVSILASDLDRTVGLVRDSDPVRLPPARIVYRLIGADPNFAARIVERLSEVDAEGAMLESLAYFAYDASRLARVRGLAISLEKDGSFLLQLLEDQGQEWLEDSIFKVVSLYGERVRREEVAGDFLPSYQETLSRAVDTLPEGDERAILRGIVERVFAQWDLSDQDSQLRRNNTNRPAR